MWFSWNIFSFLANYIGMNNLLFSLKKSFSHLIYPFIFTALILLLVNLISIIPLDAFQNVYALIKSNLELLFGFLCSFYVSYYSYKKGKIAIVSATGYIALDLAFYSITNVHFSLLFALAYAFIVSKLSSELDLIYRFIILLLVGAVVGIALGLCYGYLFNALKLFCVFVSKKPLLFGVFDNAYSVLFGDNFSQLMLTKDYSASTIVQNRLVAGVQNVFEQDPKHPLKAVAYYMSGRYFLGVFSTLGIFIALYNRFNNNEMFSFILCSLIAFLFGDIKLLALFLICYNPVLYLAYLVMTFVCYLVPVLLDIRIGYIKTGSVVELIKYGQKWVYFFIAGIVIAIMTYFVFQLAISKYDLSKSKIYPRDVKRIVTALGGDRNIERLDDKNVYVKNPNLIDVLKLDCDIHENVITLHYGEHERLKEYF